MHYLAPACCLVAAIIFLIEGVRTNSLPPFGFLALAIAGLVVTA